MPTDDRFYARLAIVLLVSAFLVTVIISAFSSDGHAIIFFGLAITFATLFAVISWTQRSSKFVVAIAGFTGIVIIATSIILTQPMPWQVKSAEASYQAIAAQHEATRLQAIAERERQNTGNLSENP